MSKRKAYILNVCAQASARKAKQDRRQLRVGERKRRIEVRERERGELASK